MRKRFFGLVCGLLFCAGAGYAQDRHDVTPTVLTKGGTSLEIVAQRFETEALDHQKNYPDGTVARTVDFDSVFPKDAAEFARMDKYAVMLVSAISHDQTELPVKVYLTLNDRSLALQEIAHMRRDVPAGSAAYAEFGPYREDVLVLVPAILLFTEARFQADFAAHRTGFEFGKGPLRAPAYLAADHSLVTVPTSDGPPADVVKTLIEREYPGFWPN